MPSEPIPGAISDSIACRDNPTQSYALYLPSSYSAERSWPILYCFDPGARGKRPVERFRKAADLYGYIIVGSNNSRNGMRTDPSIPIIAILRDTHQRFRIDDRRLYAAGFSGGARVANFVAMAAKFAGVIASGGGFSNGKLPPPISYAFFGSAGREDFNYREMKQIDAALNEQHARHRLIIFEGAHEWLPEAEAVEALEWMELQAMRSGLCTKDEALIGQLLGKRMQTAAAIKPPGEAYLAYLSIAEDFEGLANTADAAGKVAAMKDTKPIRQYFKADKKEDSQEEAWRDRLQLAVNSARNWSADKDSRISLSQRNGIRSAESLRGSAMNSSQDSGAGTGSADWSGQNSEDMAETDNSIDRYDALRNAVAEISREAKARASAVRALNGAYASLVERARYLVEDGKFDPATENFEMAAIIRPESPNPLFEVARIQALQGDKSRARDSLQAALAKGFKDGDRIKQLQELLAR